MESSLSCLSSLKEEVTPGDYIQPHYKESYRLAIYALVSGGREAYQDYLKAEQISDFLSEKELTFIQENAELPVLDDLEMKSGTEENSPSTYFPTESDEDVPDLDLGWPEVAHENSETNISLLFHPARHNSPTIKEVIRKQIQEARQVIAIAMDVFTDVDIFKEIVSAALRGVVVYILLDYFQFKDFLTMTERSGVCIQDLKNVRVRTVKGQQYQCRSGAKFYGALEQRFILVDCKTVLYGTYSYMWSYEKINLSMVLVVTGQLVGSYDEEFRRLFARSSLPAAHSQERVVLKDPMPMYSPNSSQTSLHLIHLRSRTRAIGLRSSTGQHKDERYNHKHMLTRRLSIQDRPNHSHQRERGRLVRGHSFAGELHKVNGAHGAPERNRSNHWSREDLVEGKMNQLLHKRKSQYSTDPKVLPFNSETSLHRWKIESYLKNSDPIAESNESLLHTDLLPESKKIPIPSSRMRSSLIVGSSNLDECPSHTSDNTIVSPHGSQSGLANNRPQFTPSRWMENQTRLEEIRLKRNSLQENKDLISDLRSGQSQDSLKSVFSTLERAKERPSASVLDKVESMAELEHRTGQTGYGLIPVNQLDGGNQVKEKEGDQTYATSNLTESHRSISHCDIKTMTERKNPQSLDWHEPLSRTTSEANLGTKLMEPSLKPSNFRPTCLNVEDTRMLISLIGIPEEKEGPTSSNLGSTNQLANRLEAVPLSDENRTPLIEETPLQRMKSVRSTTSAESEHVEAKRLVGKERKTFEEASTFQRKNSIRSRISAIFHSDEQKTQVKEETMLQRKNSWRSGTSSCSKHLVQVDISVEQRTMSDAPAKSSVDLKGQKAYNVVGVEGEKEQHSNPYTTGQGPSAGLIQHHLGQDSLGSRITLEGVGSSAPEHKRKKAYSRFEHFLSVEKRPSENPTPTNPEVNSSDNRSMFLSSSRRPSVCSTQSYTSYRTPNVTENKFGRFIQRVGNLINKNK